MYLKQGAHWSDRKSSYKKLNGYYILLQPNSGMASMLYMAFMQTGKNTVNMYTPSSINTTTALQTASTNTDAISKF